MNLLTSIHLLTISRVIVKLFNPYITNQCLAATCFIISSSVLTSSNLSEKKKLRFLSSLYFSYKLLLRVYALLLLAFDLVFFLPSVSPFLLTS